MTHLQGRIKLRLFKEPRALALGLLFGALCQLPAKAVEWEFKPPRAGLAMVVENPIGGNWLVERPLAKVNSSPEFTFPLQLFYHSARTARGIFGDQWFCPQLESTLIPKGKNVLLWNPPWGGVVALFADESRPNHFLDRKYKHVAKVSGVQTAITSNDGWCYTYRNGHIEMIQAPTGRQLDFVYSASVLSQVILRDPTSNLSQPLLNAGHDVRGHINKLVVGTMCYQFEYANGPDGRLNAIIRPGIAEPEKIEYDRTGVLGSIKPPGAAPVVFKTEYAKTDRNRQPDPNPNERQKPGNYRLLDDGTLWYCYDKEGGVTTFDRSGIWQSFQASKKRNTETTRNSAGEVIVKYFYMAPGRKHNGKLNRIEKNGRVVLENFYDKRNGNLIESRDENGICTTYEYSSTKSFSDRPVRISRGPRDGTRELLQFLQYDAIGRIVSKTEPGKRITLYNYNSRGELENITNPDGSRIIFRRDPKGRVVNVSDGNQEESVQFDENGRIRARTQPDGQTAEFSYDGSGNVSAVKQNGITVVKYQRDKFGIITAQSDSIGRTTQFERDSNGNIQAETHPDGFVTKYEYDQASHKIAEVDGNGNRTTFKYDLGGHLIEKKDAHGKTLTWTYDPQGKLISRSNGVQQATNTYNQKGRLALVDFGIPGEKITYTYDEQGRLKKASTPTNSETIFYDSKNRIIARQFIRGDTQRVVRYAWDASGRKISVVLSEKETGPKESNSYKRLQLTEYSYDSKGKLLETKSNGSSICRYQYDKKGRLEAKQFGNGITCRYKFDIFGRQTQLDLSGGPLVQPLSLTYLWTSAGQIQSRTWNKETQVYTYDPRGRLASVSKLKQPQQLPQNSDKQSVSLQESYSFDAAGNMLSATQNGNVTRLTYSSANQIESTVAGANTTQFKYDLAGRLVSQTSGDQTQSRTYGFLDKLITISSPDRKFVGFDYFPNGQIAIKGSVPSIPAPDRPGEKPQNGVAQFFSNLAKGNEAEEKPNAIQSAINQNVIEEYVWDGNAMLFRSGTTFVIEPEASGEVPIAVNDLSKPESPTYFLNDVLGTTLAVIRPNRVEIVNLESSAPAEGKRSSTPEPTPLSTPSIQIQ